MIKKSVFSIALFSLVSMLILCGIANAYWIWTPETKKFTNPKYAVKDSPKEQLDWAMSFYNAKDFQRASTEFEKLAKQYEFSEYASKAQYYVGLCYENMNKYYLAYQNYQKAIDNFPHIANTEEILAREFAIGNLYLSKPGPKVLGTDIMAPLDRAVEIFKKVVENAPYGKFAEESQFKLGEALKKSERYEEAVQAYHKIVEDYPKSKLVTQAMYEESHCAYKASLKPAYDAAATDNAIKTFEKFVYKNKDADLAKNADTTMRRLKDNVSEKSFKAAEFYEAQGKTQAAIIYYQDVIDTYPDSSFVNRSKAKIEALKAKSSRKSAAPIDLSKKKPEQIVRQKKPWSPLKFKSESKKKKAEVAAQTAPANEASKKAWKPLSFDAVKKTQPKKAPEAPVTAPVAEAPVTPSAPQAIEVPVAQIQTTEPQTVEVAKKEELPTQVPQNETPKIEAPKKKSWKPFNFDTTKKPAAKEPVVKEPAKKSSWNLFNLGTKKESVAKEVTPKKAWKPLNFDTVKKVQPKKAPEVPMAVEIPAAQTNKEEITAPVAEAPVTPSAPQVVGAPKVEPSAQPVETVAVVTPVVQAQVAIESQAVEVPKKEEQALKSSQIKAPKKKAWKPLYFGTNDEPMATTNRRW